MSTKLLYLPPQIHEASVLRNGSSHKKRKRTYLPSRFHQLLIYHGEQQYNITRTYLCTPNFLSWLPPTRGHYSVILLALSYLFSNRSVIFVLVSLIYKGVFNSSFHFP